MVYGWLRNVARRERCDRPMTLTDEDVQKLIFKVDSMVDYSKLSMEKDALLRLRDKALIALAWIFFKRGNEILNLKLGDVYFDDDYLAVTFVILKKKKNYKVCPECNTKNAGGSSFCKKCGSDIHLVPKRAFGKSLVSTKTKTRIYPFTHYVIEWVTKLKQMGRMPEDYLFPPCKYFGETFQFDKHLTIQRFDQILQRLDPTLSSCMFRYGHTEVLFRMGFTSIELQDIGDWASSIMPELYAKRKGLTPAQKKFAELPL